MPKKERRHYKRMVKTLNSQLSDILSADSQIKGVVQDISPYGIRLKTLKKLNNGTIHTCRIKLPGKAHYVDSLIKTKWHIKTNKEFEIGAKIIDLDEKSIYNLALFLTAR